MPGTMSRSLRAGIGGPPGVWPHKSRLIWIADAGYCP